ncbi:hypothetical protein [Tardiphaga alba]|uniref:hypothetical protein n=1 Tax=Tardiphaga alba TaxID=340268 RepID=UPI0038B53A3A
MKNSIAAAIVAVAGLALPSVASAGCYNCYAPPPCTTCYQQQVIPPQYRTVEETVQVAPSRVVRHHRPAQYRTVMVPKTVMVAPASVDYERIPAQYATQQRTVQVAPAQVYYQPVQTGCASCGRNGFNFGFGSGYGAYGY